MHVWFTFRHAMPGFNIRNTEHRNNCAIVTETLFDLFDIEPGLMRKHGLHAPFVYEFNTGRKVGWLKDILSGKTPPKEAMSKFARWFKVHVLNDPYTRFDEWKGPSTAFTPADLKRWAQTWQKYLKSMNELDYGSILDEPDTVGAVLRELSDLIAFADRSQEAKVQLVLEAKY
jgi:hypothetical protein